jgi:hypothetical protein
MKKQVLRKTETKIVGKRRITPSKTGRIVSRFDVLMEEAMKTSFFVTLRTVGGTSLGFSMPAKLSALLELKEGDKFFIGGTVKGVKKPFIVLFGSGQMSLEGLEFGNNYLS